MQKGRSGGALTLTLSLREMELRISPWLYSLSLKSACKMALHYGETLREESGRCRFET